jgi:quercetin dioxygenase-like cupin family protein
MTAATASPRVLRNPVLGLEGTVRTSAEESQGEVWAADVTARPGASGGPAHIHRRQEERFRLHEGRLAYRVGDHRGVLLPGETLVVPPGTTHEFRNASAAVARFTAEFRPALRVGDFFAALFDLAAAGETDARGLPSPLKAAALMREFPDEFFYPPFPPVPVIRALAAPLGWLAARRGL